MNKTKINGLVQKDDKNLKKKIYVLENKYDEDQMRLKRKKFYTQND